MDENTQVYADGDAAITRDDNGAFRGPDGREYRRVVVTIVSEQRAVVLVPMTDEPADDALVATGSNVTGRLMAIADYEPTLCTVWDTEDECELTSFDY